MMKTHDTSAADAHGQAAVLAKALPYLRRYAGDTIVIKYGGSAMGNPALAETFGRDVALLKLVGVNPVIVHGGGPQINAMLKSLNVHSYFIDGLRVTTEDAIDVIEMVLSGKVNKEVAEQISHAGAIAVGISGKDGGLITARKLVKTKRNEAGVEEEVDLGFVGEPEAVDPRVIFALSGAGLVPVIAPIGLGRDGHTYNINADMAAGAIAAAVNASRMLMLTDVAGVLDQDKNPLSELTVEEARRGMENGMISGGMIPKVMTCLKAVQQGARAAVILDGRVPHACLLELFTEAGSGTLIRADS